MKELLIVSKCRGTVKVKPEEFPLLLSEALILMMIHTVDVEAGTGWQRVGVLEDAQLASPRNGVDDQKAVQVGPLGKVWREGFKIPCFLYIEKQPARGDGRGIDMADRISTNQDAAFCSHVNEYDCES